MSARCKFPRLIFFALLLVLIAACGAPLAGAPPAAEEPGAEEPAAPEMTAPAEEPVEEEPPALTAVLPTPGPLPTATLAVVPPSVGGGAPEPEPQPAPAIPESRRLTLEFPPEMRTGDSARIRLQLEVDDRGGIVPTAVVEGNVVTGEVVEIPNLYETHNVIAEARLDMAGMEVQPPGTISETLLPGQSVTYYWSVRPKNAGRYEGAVWLHLRAVPRDGGEEMRIPVSVQFIEIEANSFMGLFSGGFARGVGAVGSAIGSVLGFPFFKDIVRFIFRKPKRNQSLRK